MMQCVGREPLLTGLIAATPIVLPSQPPGFSLMLVSLALLFNFDMECTTIAGVMRSNCEGSRNTHRNARTEGISSSHTLHLSQSGQEPKDEAKGKHSSSNDR